MGAPRSAAPTLSATHAPVALTRARASTVSRRPETVSRRSTRQRAVASARRHDLGAHADVRAARRSVHGVEHHQARIVHPAVGIFEAARKARLQRLAGRGAREIDGVGRRQDAAAPAQVVVEEEPEPDQQGRAQAAMMREHEPERPDDVRGHGEQHLPLAQRLAHQAEGEVLQVAQPAVDELGRGRGRAAGQVGLLRQQHGQSAPGGIAGDAAAVDAPADDGNVVHSAARARVVDRSRPDRRSPALRPAPERIRSIPNEDYRAFAKDQASAAISTATSLSRQMSRRRGGGGASVTK